MADRVPYEQSVISLTERGEQQAIEVMVKRSAMTCTPCLIPQESTSTSAFGSSPTLENMKKRWHYSLI